MTRTRPLVAIAVAALLASGCISLSVFQGPEALDEGELVGGIGAVTFPAAGDSADSTIGVWPEAGLRYGLGNGFDIGAKFAGFPPFGAVYGDVRWQLLSSPVPVTAGLGGSYAGLSSDDGDDISFSAVYPSLAVGTDRLWVAGRGIIISSGVADEVFLSPALWGLVVGTSFGDGIKLLPEVALYVGPDDSLLGFGLGLQLGIAGGDDGG